MSATATTSPRTLHYLNVEHGIRSWLLTLDHKRIALLYLFSVTFFFFIGGLMAVFIRLELATPAGDLVEPDTYNRLFTAHGVIMIFLYLIPAIPAVLGNFLVPLMIGAKDLAFPKLNLGSWYVYNLGALFMTVALLRGGADTGWTFYTPYSTTYANSEVILTALGAFIVGFSSIMTGLNFIVTIHRMRAPGLTWFRLPLFIWAMYATSLIQILGTPVIAITILLIAAERLLVSHTRVQTSLRQLARESGISSSRLCGYEQKLTDAIRRHLEADPQAAYLVELANDETAGFDTPLDEEHHRHLMDAELGAFENDEAA